MIRRYALLFALLAATASLAAAAQGPAFPAAAQSNVWLAGSDSNDSAEANDREDELYQDGQGYLDEGKWEKALEKFTQVAEMRGRRADAAAVA